MILIGICIYLLTFSYLRRFHESCDSISAEISKEQYLFQREREEIVGVIVELNQRKQTLWEESQSLLSHLQTSRQEIESITSVIGERKREKEELDEMLKVIPKVSEVEGMNGSNRFVTSI